MSVNSKPTPISGIALYLRVSTDDMQNPENSFEYQRQRIEACVDRCDLNLPIVSEYSDVLSGRTPQRPDYQKMLDDARNGMFSHIATYSVDRLGRNTQETLNALEELSTQGIEVVVADSPNLDMETPSGNLFLRMRVIIAQYEVEMMSQRIHDTKRAILASGGWPSTLPDGYVFVEEE
jgi:site-specific DNA recombinase